MSTMAFGDYHSIEQHPIRFLHNHPYQLYIWNHPVFKSSKSGQGMSKGLVDPCGRRSEAEGVLGLATFSKGSGLKGLRV